MSRGTYFQTRDRWWRVAGEAAVFGALAAVYGLTWLLPNRWLAGALAPVCGLGALLIPGVRRRAEANLRLVHPEMDGPARRRMIRRTGTAFGCLAVEYARFERLPRRPDCARIAAGREFIETARASGKGAVIVSAHFGNWEAIRIAARALGVEVGIIYRAFNNRFLDRYALRLIAAAGTPVLQKGRSGNRRLVSHVMKGGAVLILVDQRNTGAPLIPFLGHDCETATAAADIARRAGVPLIPVVSRRVSMRPEFEVTFEEPVAAGDPVAMMAEVNRRIGGWVAETPEQWLWFHRRWKKRRRGA